MGKVRNILICLTLILMTSLSLCACNKSETEEQTRSGSVAASEDSSVYGLSNPVTAHSNQGDIFSDLLETGATTTWDCIYFGNYWQNDTNGDGNVDEQDEKQPIKWRVLSVTGDDAFILSDQNLDCQPYCDKEAKTSRTTWETCSLRKWLNSSFLSEAFSPEEQKAIQDTKVINEDSFFNDEKNAGGNDTIDKIYLLSISEVYNEQYGFGIQLSDGDERLGANNTVYVKEEPCWWLRTIGSSMYKASYMRSDGFINETSTSDSVAVRPVLHLNLSSSSWKMAGKVSASKNTK